MMSIKSFGFYIQLKDKFNKHREACLGLEFLIYTKKNK